MTRWWPAALVLIGLGIILAAVHLDIRKRQMIIETSRTTDLPLDEPEPADP